MDNVGIHNVQDDEIRVVEKQQMVNFDEELEQIYQAFLDNDLQMTTSMDERVKKLIMNPKELLDTRSYIYVLFMEGKKYDWEGNRNAARFCAMRMLWIRECYEGKRKKKPRFLTMCSFEFTSAMNIYIEEYTGFLEGTYQAINKKLLMITIVLSMMVCAVLIFLLQTNLLMAVVETLLLGAIMYWMQKRRLPDMFQRNQTQVLEDYVEEAILDFDRPIRIA